MSSRSYVHNDTLVGTLTGSPCIVQWSVFKKPVYLCKFWSGATTGDGDSLLLHETHFPKETGKMAYQEDPSNSPVNVCSVCLSIQLGRSSKYLLTLLQIKLINSQSVLTVTERTDSSPRHNCTSFKDKKMCVPFPPSLRCMNTPSLLVSLNYLLYKLLVALLLFSVISFKMYRFSVLIYTQYFKRCLPSS